MATTITIPTKKLARRFAQWTTKRTVHVQVVENGAKVHASDTYWDGGTRSEYFYVHLVTGNAAWKGEGEVLVADTQFMVMEKGHFQGKTVKPTFYLLAQSLPVLFDIKTPLVSDTPLPVLVDFLLDNERDDEASLLRLFL